MLPGMGHPCVETNSKLQAANAPTTRRVGGSQERSPAWIMPGIWHARVCSLQPYLPQAQQPDVEMVWDGVCHPALARANLVFSSMRLHSPVSVKGPTGAVSILETSIVGTRSVSGEWWMHCSPAGSCPGHRENGVCSASARLTYYPACVLPAGLGQHLALLSPSLTITPQVPGSPG